MKRRFTLSLFSVLFAACGPPPSNVDAGVPISTLEGMWRMTGTVKITTSQEAVTVGFPLNVVRAGDGNYRFEYNGCSLVYLADSAATSDSAHSLGPQTTCTLQKDSVLTIGSTTMPFATTFDITIRDSQARIVADTLTISGAGTGRAGANGATYEMTFAVTGRQ